jgi:hypothetical protein
MCAICIELDKSRITWKEADHILYSGEIKLEPDHFIEVLSKIDKKQKEEETN